MAIDTRIIECIKKAQGFPGVRRVGVFGSYARNEQTNGSDIDILYDYFYVNEHENGLANAMEFLNALECDLKGVLGDIKVDFTSFYGIEDCENPTIKKNVLNGVVWVYDIS